TEWLAHRREVLLRRAKFRLGQIEHRGEVLGGYLVAYLNIDKVIKIIRNEDEPKPVLMKTFKLSHVQADAILNMRLPNLRKHDEAAIEEALVEREPITVVVSEKGWIRALRGTVTDLSGIAFKTDDALKFAFPAETTSKCLVFATNGRCYTLDAAKLPGGRGHG